MIPRALIAVLVEVVAIFRPTNWYYSSSLNSQVFSCVAVSSLENSSPFCISNFIDDIPSKSFDAISALILSPAMKLYVLHCVVCGGRFDGITPAELPGLSVRPKPMRSPVMESKH